MILSPYLSIILIAVGLGLILLFRARPKAKSKRAARLMTEDMEIVADVARTTAWQVFNIDLDLSDKSIEQLDMMIANGWKEPMTAQELEVTDDSGSPGTEAIEAVEELDINDTFYAISGYVGTVLATNHNGEWRTDDEHPLPYIYFKKFDYAVSPFDLVRRKLSAPQHFSLRTEYQNVLWELDQKNKPRITEPVPDPIQPTETE